METERYWTGMIKGNGDINKTVNEMSENKMWAGKACQLNRKQLTSKIRQYVNKDASIFVETFKQTHQYVFLKIYITRKNYSYF